MITRTVILDQLRDAAGVSEVFPSDEIFDLGIDSVRLMRLTDSWRNIHPHLDFAQVVGARTVADLFDLLHVTV